MAPTFVAIAPGTGTVNYSGLTLVIDDLLIYVANFGSGSSGGFGNIPAGWSPESSEDGFTHWTIGYRFWHFGDPTTVTIPGAVTTYVVQYRGVDVFNAFGTSDIGPDALAVDFIIQNGSGSQNFTFDQPLGDHLRASVVVSGVGQGIADTSGDIVSPGLRPSVTWTQNGGSSVPVSHREGTFSLNAPSTRNLMARNAGRGRLGCGVSEAYITWQCGSPRFCGVLDTTDITYNRTLNDISEAQIVIPLSGSGTDVCCECLAEVEPWCHELHIARDGKDVWLGPITEVVYEFDKITIRALDLLGWATVRINSCTVNYTTNPDPDGLDCGFAPRGPADMSTVAQTILDYAFAEVDPCILPYLSITPSGKVNEILFEAFTDTAFEQLDNLAQQSLIDFTVVGRSIIVFGIDPPAAPIATLLDEMILGQVQLTKTGLLQANRWYVHFSDDTTVGGPGVAEAPNRYCYGLIERIKPNIGLQTSVDADGVAQGLLDATPGATMPRLLDLTDGSQLSPDAPWPFEAMIPGCRVDVGITRLCVMATESFLLNGVSVRQQTGSGEQVSLTLSPLNDNFVQGV